MHHICSFYINGCFLYLKLCCDWAAIFCYLTFYLIMSQLSTRLHLFDALRSLFSTRGRNHLSEMSAWGVSVCFGMIRSCRCLRFVCPGSGSLRTYGWYEGNENGFLYIRSSVLSLYHWNYFCMENKWTLLPAELWNDLLDLRGSIFKCVSIQFIVIFSGKTELSSAINS